MTILRLLKYILTSSLVKYRVEFDSEHDYNINCVAGVFVHVPNVVLSPQYRVLLSFSVIPSYDHIEIFKILLDIQFSLISCRI